MKNKFLLLLFLAVVITGAGVHGQGIRNDEIVVYRLPELKRVFIYRTDNVVYSASIPAGSIINNSFILPDNVRLESLLVYQEGKRIYTYTTSNAEVVVLLQRGEMPRQLRVVLIHVPELNAATGLEITYGVRDAGLTWDFVLDMEMAADNNLNSALIAQLNAGNLPEATRSIFAQAPEIILTSSSNALLEDAAFSYNLGKLKIEANKRQMIKIEEGSSRYSIVYQWDANRRERPIAYMRAQTPIKTMANNVRFYLSSGGVFNSGYNSTVNISPDRPFDISIGEQPNITTYKSLVTAEVPNRPNLPFTHTFEYHVENKSSRTINLEILIPVAIGNRHRTEYSFEKAPDERPGDQMLWRYTVDPNQKIVLKFSYDADLRNDPSYRQFDYYEGGR